MLLAKRGKIEQQRMVMTMIYALCAQEGSKCPTRE
jgi:hypothetical protein